MANNREGDERVRIDLGPDLHYGSRQAEMEILSEGLMYYPVRRGLGKTSLLLRLKHGKVIKTTQTMGYHTETIKYHKEKLNVLDIGGAPQLRKAWSKYYEEENGKTHGILFVVDAMDKDRIEEAKKELHQLMSEEIIWGVPIIVLANKQDNEDALNIENMKACLEIRDEHPCVVIGSSSITGEGLDEALKLLLFGMKVYRRQAEK